MLFMFVMLVPTYYIILATLCMQTKAVRLFDSIVSMRPTAMQKERKGNTPPTCRASSGAKSGAIALLIFSNADCCADGAHGHLLRPWHVQIGNVGGATAIFFTECFFGFGGQFCADFCVLFGVLFVTFSAPGHPGTLLGPILGARPKKRRKN